MANIKVTSVAPPYSGQTITFKSPAKGSDVNGLVVHYIEGGQENSKTFQFADAHGQNVGGKDLFASNVLVKVILDTEKNRAYVQNADTNAYLEGKFEEGKAYTDEQIKLVTETGIPKLVVYPYQEVATQEGQKVFPIRLSAFDITTDTVRVYSGITRLSPVTDYTVNADATVTLTEGVPLGRTVDIEVLKNVPLGPEGSVSGTVIAPESIPLDRLAEQVDVSGQLAEHNADVNAHTGILAPMYTYGMTDLTAGTSSLTNGKMHLVYE